MYIMIYCCWGCLYVFATPEKQRDPFNTYFSINSMTVPTQVVCLRMLNINFWRNCGHPWQLYLPDDRRSSTKRKLCISWFSQFSWLAYSHAKEGAFCNHCVPFANRSPSRDDGPLAVHQDCTCGGHDGLSATTAVSCGQQWQVWRQTWPRWLEMQVMVIWYMLQEGSLKWSTKTGMPKQRATFEKVCRWPFKMWGGKQKMPHLWQRSVQFTWSYLLPCAQVLYICTLMVISKLIINISLSCFM